MDLLTAISVRRSRRQYEDEPMTSVMIDTLRAEIDRLNAESGLAMSLVTDSHEAFRATYGLFSGVRNYVLLAGPDEPDREEKCGYWGERFVLFATAMNLGTCWVGGTYDRKLCEKQIASGTRLVCALTVGPVKEDMSIREGLKYRLIRRSTKPIEKMCVFDKREDWFMAGMEAVRLAPSAMNRQSVFFTLKCGTVTAKVSTGAYARADLGIAKLHFELAAGPGRWGWGNGALFVRDKNYSSPLN